MTAWPSLDYHQWRETRDTLHMWTQVIGKIRLALTPLVNHWWNVPIYVSGRGLTTSAIPYGERWFDMEFDFIDHVLRIRTSEGEERRVRLEPRSVAEFHAETMSVLAALGIHPRIWTTPSEVPDPIPFEQDQVHHSYDRDAATRFWRVVALSDAVLTKFRAEFVGKSSPVHFFWGSFDLAVTRFSGRATPKPDADVITREAYSHEVSSVGWWPGDARLEEASYYAYAAPEPVGFRTATILPAEAYYHETLGGFYLPYEVVRRASDPEKVLLDFCRSTYVATADLGAWDRASLERAAITPR